MDHAGAESGASSSNHPPFAVTVDLVVLTIRHGRLSVLLVRRGNEPFAGRCALPGGFVDIDEDLVTAARRELVEETGVDLGRVHLEQIATYGDPDRDPRMRVVSVAYLAVAPDLGEPAAGDDAAAAEWVAVPDVLGRGDDELAFDHAVILRDGVERARAKLEYSALARSFVGPVFTVSDLREVYQTVWGVVLDPRNFHRKVTGTPGFLEPVGGERREGAGRPATLYRAGPASDLNPPIMRPTSG